MPETVAGSSMEFMSNQLPALADVAAAALAVGLLFCLRFALALRRLRAQSGRTGGNVGNAWGTREATHFGVEREPERRHALRQLSVGSALLVVALLLYGWLVLKPASSAMPMHGSLATSTSVVRT